MQRDVVQPVLKKREEPRRLELGQEQLGQGQHQVIGDADMSLAMRIRSLACAGTASDHW